MEDELDFTVLLPDTVKPLEVEDPINTAAYLEASVGRVRIKAGKIKYAIEDIIEDVWKAHEIIVRYPAPGWTWRRYCSEIGVGNKTPLRWFQKFGLDYTITHRPLSVSNDTEAPLKPAEIVDEPQEPEVLAPIPTIRPAEHKVTEVEIEEALQSKRFVPEAIRRIKQTASNALPKKIVIGAEKSKEADPADAEGKTEEQKQEEARKEDLEDRIRTCNDALFDLQSTVRGLEKPFSSMVFARLIRVAKSLQFDPDDFSIKDDNPGSFVADNLRDLWHDLGSTGSFALLDKGETGRPDLVKEIREFATYLLQLTNKEI